jgi:pyruvate/2-oxoglutarate dehydrogenase complex dihydrolipoamide acyltransferase (E2) component
MKFLDAKQMTKPDKQENKMRPGTRPDQDGKKDAPRKHLVKKDVQDLADSLHVDLTRIVSGTGKDGEITLKDVKTLKDQQDAADKVFADK